jgi:hypothetical protein
MQLEMEAGGTPLFFDLFVAMVNHLVSLSMTGICALRPSVDD